MLLCNVLNALTWINFFLFFSHLSNSHSASVECGNNTSVFFNIHIIMILFQFMFVHINHRGFAHIISSANLFFIYSAYFILFIRNKKNDKRRNQYLIFNSQCLNIFSTVSECMRYKKKMKNLCFNMYFLLIYHIDDVERIVLQLQSENV